MKSFQCSVQALQYLLGESDTSNKFTYPHALSRMWATVQMDIDDSAIPIGVINAQVILEGHGQRCGPFITNGLAHSCPIEPLK